MQAVPNFEPRSIRLGATPLRDGSMFRVWAPEAASVDVALGRDGDELQHLRKGRDGFHTALIAGVKAGDLYRFRLDGGRLLADPCSRFQPAGPDGPSMVVDPHAYRWHDERWTGITLRGQVLYELHVGTFTAEGTFAAAEGRLQYLKDLGVTAIELMPLAEWSGRWNWGYDGVCLFAPSHQYGGVHSLQHFVDAAHAHGIGVILDVVYNHLGPSGNVLPAFAAAYFDSTRSTDWGPALNYDGENSTAVRELVISNASEWIADYHLDGLRLDATQNIYDDGQPHVLAELVHAARQAAGRRRIIIISENEPQNADHLLPVEHGGFGTDAMWNDDFHHSAMVAATGARQAYYHDYFGCPQEFVSAAKRGFLYQGQYYPWQRQCRGQWMRTAPESCVAFLQNHDQVANSLTGVRLHGLTSPGRHRALTGLLLLGPQTPMLFMGQEFNSSSPFLFFADQDKDLRSAVHNGRRQFLSQFSAIATSAAQAAITDPGSDRSFTDCKLDWQELARQQPALALHRDLLALRRADTVIAAQAADGIDGAVLGTAAFVLRWFSPDALDRLLVVNLGVEILHRPFPEPLLACRPGQKWRMVWHSDSVEYGGDGALCPVGDDGWQLPAECAVLLAAAPRERA